MNIAGISKSRLLAALYNASKPIGLGHLHYTPEDMTETQAASLIAERPYMYWDYLNGRVMKIDLSTDEVDTRLYNRDNGEGAAEAVLSKISQ